MEAGRRLCAAADVEIVTGAVEADRWREQGRRLWEAPGMIVRISWLPAALEQVIALVERIGAGRDTSVELAGRAGVGAGLVRIEADVAAAVPTKTTVPNVGANAATAAATNG